MRNLFKSSFFWFAVAAFLLLVFGPVFTLWKWDWLRDGGSETASNGDTLRNAGLLIGGALAFVFAGWRAWVSERQAATAQAQASTAERQADIAEQVLLNERYKLGTEKLGSDVLSVRLEGIYALRRLTEEHPTQYHIQIMEVTCAFVRHPTGSKEGQNGPFTDEPPNPTSLQEDVQATLNAIARRSEAGLAGERAAKYRLDLLGADLGGASLQGANLAGADLRIANLAHANLVDTDLSGAMLLAANLYRTLLMGANLHGAHLQGANLSNAMCHRIDLSNTNLDASLKNADLDSANLTGAIIGVSNLYGARLQNANLSGAIFGSGMAPSFPDIDVSEVTYTRLTQRQLDEARADPDNPPTIPDGMVDIETGEPLVWRGKPLIEEG